VRVLSETEKKGLKELAANGERLVTTGTDATDVGERQNVVRFSADPGRAYNADLEKDFDNASPDSQKAFLNSLRGSDSVKIKAGTHVATSIARTSDGHVNVFFANFAGLVAGSNPVQTSQTGVEVTLKAGPGGKGFFLPFLGEVQELKGTPRGDSLVFTLPTIDKGAVFWYEK
jgi:hypothetical protein